jgi:hypothetical protein
MNSILLLLLSLLGSSKSKIKEVPLPRATKLKLKLTRTSSKNVSFLVSHSRELITSLWHRLISPGSGFLFEFEADVAIGKYKQENTKIMLKV